MIGNIDGVPYYKVRLWKMMLVWAERNNASWEDAEKYLRKILPLIQPRIKLLSDIPSQVDFFFLEFPMYKS